MKPLSLWSKSDIAEDSVDKQKQYATTPTLLFEKQKRKTHHREQSFPTTIISQNVSSCQKLLPM